MQLKNRKLTRQEFGKIRDDEVINSWKTGKNVDIDEGIQYQLKMPDSKNFALKLTAAIEQQQTLVQPRAGVSLASDHISLLKKLSQEGQADLLPTTIDSYTRQNRYEEAETALQEGVRSGRSLLNGFPAVNHGVDTCRSIIESLDKPIEIRHGTPDARLLGEITLAAGFTSFEGGGISYNIPYSKNVPLEKSIRDWQYVDYLCGRYTEEGAVVNREPFGPLTATLVPPAIANSISIIESLLAAEQGVKNITVGCGQSGNLCQDVAALKILIEQAIEYLGNDKYDNVSISTVFHQWMGGFPTEEARAIAVIAWGTVCGTLAGATKIIAKTPQEATGIPSAAANVEGLRATKQAVNMTENQIFPNNDRLREEMGLLRRETDCILKRVYELGEGDWAIGTVRAFEAGVLDVPFAPARANANKVLPARDLEGCIRLLDPGSLPLDDDIIQFHQNKLIERGRAEGRDVNFNMLTDDIYAVSKGRLVGKPKK